MALGRKALELDGNVEKVHANRRRCCTDPLPPVLLRHVNVFTLTLTLTLTLHCCYHGEGRRKGGATGMERGKDGGKEEGSVLAAKLF